jgi:hypothetical protein
MEAVVFIIISIGASRLNNTDGRLESHTSVAPAVVVNEI